jgi:hypothetical protein
MKKVETGTAMKGINLEDLAAWTVLSFLENAKELGYKGDSLRGAKEWVGGMPIGKAQKVFGKLLDLMK